MIKILKYIKLKEWGFIAIAGILIFGQVWLELEMPLFMKEITTIANTPNPDVWEIVKNGLFMLGYAFGSFLLALVVGFIFAKIASAFSARMRSIMFNKTTEFSMSEMNKFSTPSLITRSTNDISQVQMLISMGAQLILKAPLLAVFSILKISSAEWQWSTITGGAIFIISAVLVTIVVFAVPRFKKIQKNTDNLNKYTRENLTGLRVIKAYNAEEFQTKKIDSVNDELMSDGLFTGKIMSLINPTMSFVFSGVTLAIYFVGAFLINNIEINPLDPLTSVMQRVEIFSNMTVFLQYAMQVIMAFMMLVMIFFIYPRAQVSAVRILEVINTTSNIKDGKKKLQSIESIEFKNVSFKYPDASDYVLENLNFNAKKGQTIAIIGSTGAGKSTLINLIPRFYDVTDGEIIINKEDIRSFKQKDLRKKIGYISQQAFLFSGTVEYNVNYGLESNKDLDNALNIAQASDFVNNLDEKEKSRVSQSGKNFSGGQKQRLSIARAVQKESDVLIFDDSFSALDYKTDKNLRDAIRKNLDNQIAIIVAQRIGTIKNADLILVLDEGKIVGSGTHKELLETNKVYKEIALSQLSSEELSYE